jgi:hypothetical protein
MGGIRSTHDDNGECIQNFKIEALNRKGHMGDFVVDGKIA